MSTMTSEELKRLEELARAQRDAWEGLENVRYQLRVNPFGTSASAYHRAITRLAETRTNLRDLIERRSE